MKKNLIFLILLFIAGINVSAINNLRDVGYQNALDQKDYYEREMKINRGEVLWAYTTWVQLDSSVNATDSIIAFLVGESDLASKKLLVATYYNAGKLSEANNLLGEIETDGSEELANFMAYYYLLITANLDSRNIFQLTDEEWITLETIASTRSSAAESAKGILTLVKGYNFDAYIEKEVVEEEAMMAKNTSVASNVIAKQTNKLNVYPNPANHSIFIKYKIDAPNTITTISLIDVTGKIVLTKKTNNNGIIEIDTQNLSNGVYFVHLTNVELNIVSKIVITH